MSPTPVAEHEVQRILAMIPWLTQHPGVRLDEVAARFGVSRDQVRVDLDLVLMVGVPPYTPAEYLDVVVEDDAVWLRLGAFFDRPLRLAADEGLALLIAGRALLAVPGADPDGPLGSALAKLEAALDMPTLDLDVGDADHLEAVQIAVADGAQLEIDYWTAGRDARSTRRIDPLQLFFADGRWYLAAYCHQARDERTFRVDRIRSVQSSGQRSEVTSGQRAVMVDDHVFQASPDDERVTLVVPAALAWIGEAHPTESVEVLTDGTRRIVLAVSESEWLERLLLRLGPAVEIEAPAHWRDRRRAAAGRVLARYDQG